MTVDSVIINLLNKELRLLGDRLGVFHEPHREKFYFPCFGESRTETWTTRMGRRSDLIVARRVWDERLGRSAFFHLAVIARFIFDNGKLFLQLSPTIQLTEDGRWPIYGEKEGRFITSFLSHKYNDSYLSTILFWIARFAENKNTLDLARGSITVSAKPLECNVEVGILSDRPASEPLPTSQEADDQI